ncbi:hypothetical protein HIM_12627 [Hirsutella minnesotensis 3608]|uniref:CCHC-type domain-containing protein n=1 Tax=Hirsutella minnesotensis 3608 TaxID=1043627 RepID=A0A0F7ZHT8_9HYPO|nr:hypothetical protein HIM_12627 [Hirsutella minnesotensis 3608]
MYWPPSPTGGGIVKRKLLDGTAKEINKSGRYATRATRKEPVEKDRTRVSRDESVNSSDVELATIEKVWELLAEYRSEFQGLKETLKEQNQIIRDQQEIIRKQKDEAEKQEKTNRELSLHWEDITQQMRDQLKHVQQQLEATIVGSAVTPPSTFAEVARSSPSPQRNTLRSPSSGSPAAATANEFFCMIDTSRVEEQDRGRAQIGSIRQAVENEVRTKEGQTTWRCAAVVRNSRNTEQVKIICRDEIELQRVKEAAQKTAVTGARVMRDQLYPVKVDNVNRTAILDGQGDILQGAAEALGAENNVSIGKITWLSNKETSKAYGSMVVYVTKKNDAKKLLDGKYFDLAGESACTNPFEPRKGLMQCFNCQEMGHKAFKCKATQAGAVAEEPSCRARSTTLRLALAQQQRDQLPENVGKHSKRIDRALPGRHTRTLYDGLTRKEADILVQLRTGMSRLNGYLHAIGATDSGLCECGQAQETVDHFLFRCTKWIVQRDILFECARAKIGNLSFFLGGKAASDGDKWKPDMQAVRAAIKFAIETERLDRKQQPSEDN